MPWVDKATRATIQLYNRCRSWERLPNSGGLNNQDETLMRDFDAIDEVITKHRRRVQESQDIEMRNDVALRALNGRH